MFASIRKYNVRRGSAEELARRVRGGFVPMMRQIQGFRSYYLLDGGPDVLITISIFAGLGLALVSQTARRRGGYVNVENADGAIFTVFMPHVRAAAAGAAR